MKKIYVSARLFLCLGIFLHLCVLVGLYSIYEQIFVLKEYNLFVNIVCFLLYAGALINWYREYFK